MTPPSTSHDPQHWRRIDEIFAAVADLPADERAGRVTELAAGDELLADDVLRLLAQDDASGARIASVLAGVAQWAPAEAANGPDITGMRLGPYRVVRELGRGGMGVVYEGVREDEFTQRVAIKVAARAAFAPDLLARFRDERQILARLTHPRIARLVDGGTTETGVPWFAMEFVDGVPIHRHVAATQPTLPTRLRLFLQVCEAVDYAHQNLIVHRDLKPANILVTGDGARLLDFGIAKLLQEAGDATMTSGVSTPVTPDYCSPEQARGEPITTRTDVYSLGLVLYELLTGARAQTADTSSPLALARSICDTPVPAPSAAPGVASGPLARRLRGDLDTIVLCATQKDPARRYPSVAALAGDVRRHLDGLPIVARQDSRAYRLRRFVRRHWLPLGAAAALLASLAGGVVATRYQARRAERRFEQVRGIARALMNDVYIAIRDLPSSSKAQETVLKTAIDYLDGLAREAGGDRALQLEIADGYLKASEIAYSMERPSLGRPEDGRRYMQNAAALLAPFEAAASSDPDVAASFAELARLQSDLALDASNREAALSALLKGMTIGEAALQQAPDHLPLLAALQETMIDALSKFDTNAEVMAKLPRLLETATHRLSLAPDDIDAQGSLAVAYSKAGAVETSRENHELARRYYQQAADLHARIIAAMPDNVTARRNRLIVLANLGDSFLGPLGSASYTGPGGPPRPLSDDDRAAALRAMRAACDEAAYLYGKDPTNDTVIFDLAVCRGRSAPAFPEGDPAAIAALTESLTLLQPLATRHPARVAAHEVEFRGSLAERHRQARRYDAADAEWARIDAIVRAGVAREPKSYYLRRQALSILENQAETLVARGRLADARRVAAKVEALADFVGAATEYARGPGWPPRVHGWHAELYAKMGDAAAAQVSREKSLAQWRTVAARTDVPEDLLAEARAAVAAADAVSPSPAASSGPRPPAAPAR